MVGMGALTKMRNVGRIGGERLDRWRLLHAKNVAMSRCAVTYPGSEHEKQDLKISEFLGEVVEVLLQEHPEIAEDLEVCVGIGILPATGHVVLTVSQDRS